MKINKNIIILILTIILFTQTVLLIEYKKEVEDLRHHKDILTNSLGVFYKEYKQESTKIDIDFTQPENVLLAKIVHAEAKGEGLEGKQIVAEVILNRVEHEIFPDTIKEVVSQPRQFQPYSSRSYLNEKPNEETYRAIVKAYNERNLPENVLYFCNYDIISDANKRWFDTKEYYDKVGNHTFFGEVE